MQRWWKWLVGVAVVVPLLAYVGGSLAAAQDEPTRREPIRITVDPSTGSTSPSGTATDDDPGDDRDPSEGPETVRPSPDDLDDDSDDAGRDDGDDDASDDHSGSDHNGDDDRSHDDREDRDDRDDRSGHGGDDSDSGDDD